ncbi:MAG: hypothetical protein OXE50_02430 [Chloroflexi bacterium]|nr:hypothetical protein [Chloroflexota bacterium]
MQIQERLIVPGLGVVILLSAFILGVPLVYKFLLMLLGLGAAATWFAPQAVQVETRIVIAALGLVILLVITSTAFWLTLMAFAAIAALQFPHRHTLQRSPATIEWLNAQVQRWLLHRNPAAGNEGAAAGGGEAADGGSPPVADAPPTFGRGTPAGIGSSVLGALVLLSLFIPWVWLLVVFDQEVWGGREDEWQGMGHTLLGAAGVLESSVPYVFFGILLVLGLLSAASVVLPRAVVAIAAVAGWLVSVSSYFFFFEPLVENLFT